MLAACGNSKGETIDYEYNKDSIPMVASDSVTMLISDSGLIRYKVIAKTWDIYESEKDPYWLFPDKLYLEQFDSLFQVVATVEADSVWNYTKRKLWLLKGNVFIKNNLNETFSGEELFWDQDKHQVYSNQLLEIKRPGRMTLIAQRFKSNERMTDYTFISAHAPEIYTQTGGNTEEPEKNAEKEE